MPAQADKTSVYRWQGTDRQGAPASGESTGHSQAMIRARLRRQGITVSKIRRHTDRDTPAGKPVKAVQITLFTRQLATLIRAGIPLLQALEVIANGLEHQSMASW